MIFMKLGLYFIYILALCTYMLDIKTLLKHDFFNFMISTLASSSLTTIYLSNTVFLDFQGSFVCL